MKFNERKSSKQTISDFYLKILKFSDVFKIFISKINESMKFLPLPLKDIKTVSDII